jgi:hypothetical protein
VTTDGFDALATWMVTVDDERALLSAVLKRYDSILDGQVDDDTDARSG